MFGIGTAMAQGAAEAAKQPGLMDMLILPAGIFMILYFLMIRPQQKKTKEQQGFIAALKNGDEVITGGGIIGVVRSVAEQFVTIEVSSNTNIKVMKNQLSGPTKAQAPVKLAKPAK